MLKKNVGKLNTFLVIDDYIVTIMMDVCLPFKWLKNIVSTQIYDNIKIIWQSNIIDLSLKVKIQNTVQLIQLNYFF